MKTGAPTGGQGHSLEVQGNQGQVYPVVCGLAPAEALTAVWKPGWRQSVLLADTNSMRLRAQAIREALQRLGVSILELEIPAGEKHKTRATWARLHDRMLEAGIERGACLIAVGGGVVLDLGGFVAATYLRGIDHIHVPTTLLAQVDAAVGGKTGVNTPRGKNLIGAFHHPRAVLVDTEALGSLPVREFRCGLAEAIKHAVLADAALFHRLEAWASEDPEDGRGVFPEDLLLRCIAIKAEVVAADGRDHGRRQTLNFGHTAAHGIEAGTRHRTFHGEAVAVGMLIEARVARELLGFPEADLRRLESLLKRVGLPIVAQCSFEKARPALLLDKKNQAGNVHCSLPLELGRMDDAGGRWTRPVPLELLARAWKALP